MHNFIDTTDSGKTVAIVILNDGETYSDIRGCSICIITREEQEALDNGSITCGDLKPIVEIGLSKFATTS
jgi:hypothetical protein